MRRVPPGGTIREEPGGVATGQVYSLNSSAVKNLPAMQETQETWVQSLGWEDPLEEGMATYSSTLAWRIPWTEEPGGLQPKGSDTNSRTQLKQLSMHIHRLRNSVATKCHIFQSFWLKGGEACSTVLETPDLEHGLDMP